MKKQLLLLSYFLFLFTTNNAQTWCPAGAIWNYTFVPKFWMQIPKSGAVEDKYVGDTIINGINCKHIQGTFFGKLSPFSPTVTVLNYRNSYSHLSNGVLYASPNGSSFDTIVNFNATIGDKWLKNIFIGPCNSRKPINVIDTGRVVINNLSLKKIVTSYTSSYVYATTTYTVGYIDTIIERIMSRINFMYPTYCEADNITDFYVDNGTFNCYHDDRFVLYKRAGVMDCGYLSIGLNEMKPVNNKVEIFPNPTSDVLYLTTKNKVDYSVQLFDYSGQRMGNDQFIANDGHLQINVVSLKRGMYFLRIYYKDGQVQNEKIIKNN
jgi:hypothetical protein